MKILVVCQYYYPESFKVTDVCESLAALGHDVTVLTGLPNYPTGIVPLEYKSGAHNDEVVNGVHVIRCLEIGRKKGVVHLALNYASFYFSAMRAIKKIKGNFDVVYSYQLSPIFMALPARWYKKRYKVPMFLYCCDLWPESLKMYIKSESNPAFKWVKHISKKVYDAADMIATQSESFISYLKDVHNIDSSKLTYIPNFADEEYLSKDFSAENNGAIDFVFLGNVGIAQNLTKVIDAFKAACNEVDMKLHIVGGGALVDDLKKQAKELLIDDKVIFYGQKPVEEMPIYYKLADACIVSLKSDNATGLTLPAKVQGYMAAGKPIIGMITGSANETIKAAECGICVEAEDVDGLKDAFIKFASLSEEDRLRYGASGREYFIKHFRKDIHISRINEELKKLIKE
ncbi:MAG: glycosyltransferase family 4 protein [Lachnospiraceae bacterium]|nr:glycosyltransferase family 4 protein [Lachnospiraceae bacterium]